MTILKRMKFNVYHLLPRWSTKHILGLVLTSLVVYVACSAALSEYWQIQVSSREEATIVPYDLGEPVEKFQTIGTRVTPADSLLERTRRAVERAGGVPGGELSGKDRQQWESDCPCEGRKELLDLWTRRKKPSAQPSSKLESLFQEYSTLHRTCTVGGNMSHVSELYRQRGSATGNSTGSGCDFLVVEFGIYGIGNRVLWLVSAYLYALLTQRVLLIDTRDTIHQILCEPFAGSSWQLGDDFPYSSAVKRWQMAEEFNDVWDAWEDGRSDPRDAPPEMFPEEEETRAALERLRAYTSVKSERERKGIEDFIRAKIAGTKRRKMPQKIASLFPKDSPPFEEPSVTRISGPKKRPPPTFTEVQANDGWAPNPRFFCNKEQDRLREVQWLSMSAGCLYFLPDLFAVPSFNPALEELFPGRNPLTHLLRQIILPADAVWKRIQLVHNDKLKSASKVVGMQVRFRDGGAMFHALNDRVNTRITRCAREHDLIPDPAALNSTEGNCNGGPVLIFIASLHTGIQSHLQDYYGEILEQKIESEKPKLELLQLSNYGYQAFDLDGDFQAFAELIILSLSDEIMTSPMSTFGYIAQAYGSLRPWIVEFSMKSSRDCELGQSSDACYQMAQTKFSCPKDPVLNGKYLRNVAPYLQPCQDTDGLQLVSPRDR